MSFTPAGALHYWIISGNVRQFFQSFLPQLKLRHGLESGNGKNLFPTIRPVVAKESFRGVATADFAEPLRLPSKLSQNLRQFGVIRVDCNSRVLPIKKSNRHFNLASSHLRQVCFARGNQKISASLDLIRQ